MVQSSNRITPRLSAGNLPNANNPKPGCFSFFSRVVRLVEESAPQRPSTRFLGIQSFFFRLVSFFRSFFYGSSASSSKYGDLSRCHYIKQLPSNLNITIDGHSIPREESWSTKPDPQDPLCNSLATSILEGKLDVPSRNNN